MAYHNEILTGRHNRFLQKLFGMKGAAPTPQLSSEISISHPIFHGAENRYLESWQRFSTFASLAAVAAQTNGMRVRNPATSNAVFVVEKATASNGNAFANQIVFGLGPVLVDMTTVAGNRSMDARNQGGGSAISSQTQNVVGTAANIQNVFLAANGSTYDLVLSENQELTILPGWAFDIFSIVANATFSGAIYWRERALEEGERQ